MTGVGGKIEQKIPSFWSDFPEQWFQILEHYFKRNGVESSADKTLTLIPLLPDRFRVELSRIDIDADDSYQSLKDIVIKRLKPSDREATENLFSCLQLGSRKPSELYNEMLCLLGDRKMDEAILRELWLRKLPPLMHPSLAAASKLPIKELVEVADNVFEATRPSTCNMPSVSTIENPETGDLSLTKLYDEIMSIKMNLARVHNRRSGRSSSRNRKRSSSRNRYQEDFCWYHKRFGNKAKRCQPPCKFSQKGNDTPRM